LGRGAAPLAGAHRDLDRRRPAGRRPTDRSRPAPAQAQARPLLLLRQRRKGACALRRPPAAGEPGPGAGAPHGDASMTEPVPILSVERAPAVHQLRVLTINTHKGFTALNRRFILPELR